MVVQGVSIGGLSGRTGTRKWGCGGCRDMGGGGDEHLFGLGCKNC